MDADSSNIDTEDPSHAYTDVNKLIREQKQDPTLKSARQEAGGGGTNYVYQDGVLYRHSTDQLEYDVLQYFYNKQEGTLPSEWLIPCQWQGTWSSNTLSITYSNTSTGPYSLGMSGWHANHAHNVRRLRKDSAAGNH